MKPVECVTPIHDPNHTSVGIYRQVLRSVPSNICWQVHDGCLDEIKLQVKHNVADIIEANI